MSPESCQKNLEQYGFYERYSKGRYYLCRKKYQKTLLKQDCKPESVEDKRADHCTQYTRNGDKADRRLASVKNEPRYQA